MNKDGFTATREIGTFSPSDLFGELGYWPEGVAWTGSAKTLSQLLDELASANRLNRKRVHAFVVEYFEEYQDVCLRSYLAEEKKAVKTKREMLQLWENWPQLHEEWQIPGIPSPNMGHGTCYDGLRLTFKKNGWSAQLDSDAGGDLPEIFCPETWYSDTFQGLLKTRGQYMSLEDVLPWSQETLAQMLIEDDPRWRPFIDSHGDSCSSSHSRSPS